MAERSFPGETRYKVKSQPIDTAERPPVAVLFGAQSEKGEGTLDELAGLAEAADVGVAGRLTQRLERPHPATYIGSGKVEELKALIGSVHAVVALADMDLSPAQARNLSRAVGVRVVDRSELIMDIFAKRARTAQAKLQVELAQLKYMLPRLRGQWGHLDRYKGGGVGTRGPGEKQLETDRRLVNRRIGDLESRLDVYARRTETNAAGRKDARKVALAGYTNTGKSTLFNAVTGSDVLAANRLFATLDTRTRKWPVKGCGDVILSDTVGFVRKLPHHLVASFHATLEEVIEADLILHVVDAADPHVADCVQAVLETLKQIGASHLPMITVLNKVDVVVDSMEVQSLLNTLSDAVPVSARTGAGLDDLEARVAEHFLGNSQLFRMRMPLSRGRTLAQVGVFADVLEREADEQQITLLLRVAEKRLPRLRSWALSEELTLEMVSGTPATDSTEKLA
ncbi:MAG: GTP-binding protein HflX [Pseudohongiellaceae bacterium]|jgi:GTP-binding protein HflX